ncbi:MAG: N-acetylmuramoyl-L-alanine amidase [Verrucomicrobiae bacterium]
MNSFCEQKAGGRLRSVGRALLALPAAWFLTSCATTGGYGPGAGVFGTVVVDAGHGGHDLGARARSGAPEKSMNLDTAQRLAGVLRRNGLHVIETRTGDYFVTLGQRVAMSNGSGGSIFVSVHYNDAPRSRAQGIEIYYQSHRSKRLAANILQETTHAYRTENRGIKNRGFYVLRNNSRPAILCELGFVSNPSDNRNIHSPEIRQQLAERIAAGILAERADRRPSP